MVSKICGIIGMVKLFLLFVFVCFCFLWYYSFAFCGIHLLHFGFNLYLVCLTSIRASDLFVVFDT